MEGCKVVADYLKFRLLAVSKKQIKILYWTKNCGQNLLDVSGDLEIVNAWNREAFAASN